MNGETFSSASLHMGTDVGIRCHVYPDSGPILAISSGGMSLTLHVNAHKQVDATDVANARTLLDAVSTFLAECERVHSAQTPEQHTPKVADPVRDAAA